MNKFDDSETVNVFNQKISFKIHLDASSTRIKEWWLPARKLFSSSNLHKQCFSCSWIMSVRIAVTYVPWEIGSVSQLRVASSALPCPSSSSTDPSATCESWVHVSVVWCGVIWCGVVWYDVVWCGAMWCNCGMVWCGVMWCSMTWYGVMWCGVSWYDEGDALIILGP